MKRSALRTYLMVSTTLLAAAICALANDCGGSSGNNSSGNSNNCGGGYTNDDSCSDNDSGSCDNGYNNVVNSILGGGSSSQNNGCGWGYGGNCSGGGSSGGSSSGNGNRQQNYTVPTGTLTVQTFDSTTMNWSGQTKPHSQTLSNQTYTAQGQLSVPSNANIDPNGTVGITRVFQNRGPNNALGAPSSIAILTQDAGLNLGKCTGATSTRTYGRYEPDQSVYSSSGTPANSVYGVETIELVYTSGTGIQTILDYKEIDVYPPATSQLTDYNTQQAVKPASSRFTYTGDAPRSE